MTNIPITSTKPKAVNFAIQLLWASLVLTGINIIIKWFDNDTIAKTMQPFPMDPMLFIAVVGLLTLIILFWLIYKISKGRNWARIIFLFGFVIGLAPIFQLFSLNDLRQAILPIIITILQFIPLCILFSKTGNAWFRTKKASS
jgi:hypothetical protein